MLLDPAILALIGVSAVTTLLLLATGGFAIQILRHWDISSGSERQLLLERRTYLVATVIAFAFGAQIVALLLFIYNAEGMSGQFVGAMCATGVLNVNAYGWPTLYFKIALFFLGALWLALNALDNKGWDYPLLRVKYALLLAIVPFAAAEFYLQARYFLGLNPDIITSCCGALFSPEAEGVAGEIAGLAPLPSLIALYGAGGATALLGLRYLKRGRGGGVFAAATLATFVVALVGIVSAVALYVYEHPNHHCPFCILKAGHGYIGYLLYLPLFGATALGLAGGGIARFGAIDSIRAAALGDSRRYTLGSLWLFAAFYAVATFAVATSHLKLLPA